MKKFWSMIAVAIAVVSVVSACKDDDEDIVTCTCTVTVSGYSQTVQADALRGECNSLTTQSLIDQGLLPAEYADLVTINCHD